MSMLGKSYLKEVLTLYVGLLEMLRMKGRSPEEEMVEIDLATIIRLLGKDRRKTGRNNLRTHRENNYRR